VLAPAEVVQLQSEFFYLEAAFFDGNES